MTKSKKILLKVHWLSLSYTVFRWHLLNNRLDIQLLLLISLLETTYSKIMIVLHEIGDMHCMFYYSVIHIRMYELISDCNYNFSIYIVI